MKIEVDQSGKVEQTHIDTIISLSNSIQISILLPRKVKRALQQLFREKKAMKFFSVRLFSFCVAQAIHLYPYKNKIIIDPEYTGHNGLIQKLIFQYLNFMNHKKTIPLEFNFVGKNSPAHHLCKKVANNKVKPTKIISLEYILKYVNP